MARRGRYTVLYDDQCELCQAGATWLRLLDREGAVDCVSLSSAGSFGEAPRPSPEDCARELHLLGPGGRLWVGGAAVRELARLFPKTRWLGRLLELWPFRRLSDGLYRFVARNRYQLSKCRGGACRTTLSRRPARAPLGAFWSCYAAGFLIRLPLIARAILGQLRRNASTYLRTRRRELSFLDGKLRVFFLGGFPSDAVPLLFGESFWTVLYGGVLLDPGGSRMLPSLRRHLLRLGGSAVRAIVATHAHEEHVGNLEAAASLCGAPVRLSAACASALRRAGRLPVMRAWVIGRPGKLTKEPQPLGSRLDSAAGELEVYPAPGHSDDHVVLYDPREKLLLAGDAFMTTYFSSPNPDVDSQLWLETLARLERLDIEVLVTGHGQIYTLRPEFPDIPGVVLRQDPKRCLAERRAFLEWLRAQVLAGTREGLPIGAIEATLFPWDRPWSWENLFADELARLLSAGEFSRSELVKTFIRRPQEIQPWLYSARCYAADSGPSEPARGAGR